MRQIELPIFNFDGMVRKIAPGMDAIEQPKVVSSAYVARCETYRQACRMAWQMRRIKKMTYTMLAAFGDFYRPHVGDWFNPDDTPTRRSLPADKVAVFEMLVGNKLVSQWLAAQAKLTVLEEMQLEREMAYA